MSAMRFSRWVLKKNFRWRSAPVNEEADCKESLLPCQAARQSNRCFRVASPSQCPTTSPSQEDRTSWPSSRNMPPRNSRRASPRKAWSRPSPRSWRSRRACGARSSRAGRSRTSWQGRLRAIYTGPADGWMKRGVAPCPTWLRISSWIWQGAPGARKTRREDVIFRGFYSIRSKGHGRSDVCFWPEADILIGVPISAPASAYPSAPSSGARVWISVEIPRLIS